MSDKKADLKRESTMKVTAKEGIKLLKDAGEHTLLELQGLANDKEADTSSSNRRGNSKPRLPRMSTMAATAKEGEEFLQEQQKKKGPKEQQQEAAKPKLSKFTTMLLTKQEGEAFLASKEEVKTNDEPVSKKLKTVNKKPLAKRISTIIRTTREGEELLKEMGHKDENPESARRTTRSQTRGDPQPPPQSPRKKPKAVKDNTTNKRGRRGRPRKNETTKEKSKEGVETPLDHDKDDQKAKDEEEEKKEEEEEEKKTGKKDGDDEVVQETSLEKGKVEEKKTNDAETLVTKQNEGN